MSAVLPLGRRSGWTPVERGVVLTGAGPGGRLLPLGIAAVVVLLPLGDTSVPGLGLSVVYVAMALPAAIGLWLLVSDQAPVPPSTILLGLGLSVAGGVVSAAGGVEPSRSVQLVVISFLTLGYAVGVGIAQRPGLVAQVSELLVVVGGVVGALALASAGSLQSAEGGSVVNGRLTGPFAQPNELGIFCAALLPVGVVCLVTAATRARVAVLGVATALLAVAWAMSMSRGAWIGGLVALVCLGVAEPRTRRALGSIGAAVVATCAASLVVPSSTMVLGLVGARIRSLGAPSQNQYDDRPLIWAEAWRQATQHPWFGVGPGGYEAAASTSASAISGEPAEHPHDLFLTVLADRGAIGVGVGVVVLVGCFLVVRRRVLRPDAGTPYGVAVVAALVAVAVHCLFDMPLRNPIVSGLVWTLLGLAVVAETTTTNRPPSPTGARPPW
ncbi:O-antigen ligase family protein [Nocardioides sp. LML1-1-1.1]|uniref:O-antigen ligase family protein n=1 Tax=Nocardioides sp. LML1-1-1.1 TaxID=3135248 RepID=UPI003428015C